MKIYAEKALSDFDFWAGAQNLANSLDSDDMDQIESVLNDIYPDGIEDVTINDLFWHDPETVLGWIGKSQCENCGEIFDGSDAHCDGCKEEEEEEEKEA